MTTLEVGQPYVYMPRCCDITLLQMFSHWIWTYNLSKSSHTLWKKYLRKLELLSILYRRIHTDIHTRVLKWNDTKNESCRVSHAMTHRAAVAGGVNNRLAVVSSGFRLLCKHEDFVCSDNLQQGTWKTSYTVFAHEPCVCVLRWSVWVVGQVQNACDLTLTKYKQPNVVKSNKKRNCIPTSQL